MGLERGLEPMDYTVKQLCEMLSISEQTFYKLLKKHKDFSEIVEENSRPVGKNKKRLYGEKCLEWLRNHYKTELVEDRVGQSNSNTENAKSPNTTSPSSKPVEKGLESGLETYIGELEAKVARQKKRIKRLNAENERLLEDNNRLLSLLEKEQEQRTGLLMTIVAEKQEKHILLDDPEKKKKHWWQKG